MNSLSYLKTSTLEAFVASDGQKFTDLIRRWAQVYLPRIGGGHTTFSINGVSFRPDGGTDGLIDAPGLIDPLGFLSPKSVLQFKAGKTSEAEARAELAKEPKDGSTRIIDRIRDGYKLVWFVGKGLTDDELKETEKAIETIVEDIRSGSPKPSVIDANRLSTCLSRTPSVASRIVGAEGLFLTTDAALADNPHARFKEFVPGAQFEHFRDDIRGFLSDGQHDERIKYIAGEPGIGKSRSVLEAIETTAGLAGLVCYFPDPSNVDRFFSLAKQECWVGACIIDEYIGQTTATIPVTGDTVPKGIKVILIGHSHLTDRGASIVTHELEPLTEPEMIAALRAAFPALQEFRIVDAIKLSRRNLRLARSICEFLSKSPDANLDLHGLEQVVDFELGRMQSGKEALAYLSLVPMLLGEQVPAFCRLVGLDPDGFKRTCRDVSQRSGLIQANDHALYVGAPALAHVALARLWRDEREKVTAILKAPGEFFDGILTAIRRMPYCTEKEEMLGFFRVPVADLGLADLLDATKGKQILQLLTADPGTYLLAIHRVIRENRGRLAEFPYERAPVDRRDLIWRLRDLAQFAEYFELAEEIVFWLALEETPSAYHNIASSYWPTWFGAWFDNTVYPYEKRLSMLEARIRSGDLKVRRLILKAIDDPFPHTGTDIPSERVGGRLAPPELRFIHHSQARLAAQRIPELFALLLETDDADFRLEIGNAICDACFSWLERGAIQAYLQMVTSPGFPAESLRKLVVQARHDISLRAELGDDVEPRSLRMHELHRELLSKIDQDDPFIEVLELAERGYWGEDDSKDIHKKQLRVSERCKADPEFKRTAFEVLADPKKHGGGPLGKLLGPDLSASDIRMLLDWAWTRGFSQFSFAAFRAFIERNPSHREELVSEARKQEGTQPGTAIAIYQSLGDDVYFDEAARMLREAKTDARFFGQFWLRSGDEVTQSVWKFIRAIDERITGGDRGAMALGVIVAGELARHNVRSEEARQLCLKVLQVSDPEHGTNNLRDWDDIGMWMLGSNPESVIKIAASKEQSEFSQATTVLAAAVESHPAEVLDALVPKLKDPYSTPILLHGGLLAVFVKVPASVFTEWLKGQDPKVWQNVAGHLPKPVMADGRAEIPEVTEAFWVLCPPGHEAFEGAMDNFIAHTYNTGVYCGFGIDLFKDRVTLSKQLLSHTNPSVRFWAEKHLSASEHMLREAIRDEHLHKARIETED